MKIIYLIFFIPLFGLGQTHEPIAIPGTKCNLVPPEGFVSSTSFTGFQNNENGASIMINELPASYFKMSEAFTSDALKTKGMTLLGKETIKFRYSNATYIRVSQQANGVKYLKQLLMFGDDNKTTMINGIYPESVEIEKEMKTSLLSTLCDDSQIANAPLEAEFSIDAKNTNFQFVKNMSGTLLYSEDGKMPSEKALIIVGRSLGRPIISENREQYAIDRLKKLPNGQFSNVEKITAITIDDLDGYEIVARGKNEKGIDELVYQVMLFSEISGYYLFVGNTTEDMQNTLAAFKSIAKTFKVIAE